MSKLLTVLVAIVCLAVASSALESPRQRFRGRARFLARQEQAVPAAEVTPYPSASELKPEVPFEEVEQSAATERIVPDAVYGPPAANDDEPFVEEDQPSSGDGPALSEESQPTEDETVEEPAPITGAERLVFPRRSFNRPRPAKFQSLNRFRQ